MTRINTFEIENVKRVKAVSYTPSPTGLTIIGGNNGQGKTSVLDALAWALGGDKFRPSQAQREGSVLPPTIKVTLDNGIIIERKGKNSPLKVTDPSGQKAGQTLLDSIIEKLALDLPKFMEASGKEKAEILLKVIGVGAQLAELDKQEKELYQERLYTGRTADQKEKFAKEQEYYPDAPNEIVSPSELIRQQQEILLRNAHNQELRLKATELERKLDDLGRQVSEAYGKATEWEKKAKELEALYNKTAEEKETAFRTCEDLQDESTAELEASIAQVDEINRKVRINLDKEKAEEDAKLYRDKYNTLSVEIEKVRDDRRALLEDANLPLPGLSVQDGELLYNNQAWDCMSGAERLKVSTAIVRRLNPECGFVLMDKLEQMDMNTLKDFGEWLEEEGLQVIATRVSTGEECSIIIEDGYIADRDGTKAAEEPAEEPAAVPAWKGRGF